MLKEAVATLLLIVGLAAAVRCAPLNGEISEDGQTRVPRVEGNVSGEMPSLAPDRRYGVIQAQDANQNQPLVGNIADFNSPPPQRAATTINAETQNQLSALGIAFKFTSGKVNIVDPGSDLYGRIFPGDRIISYDGMSPVDSYRSGSNFGNAGSIVQLTFEHNGVVATLPCRRKPVSQFSPAFQSELNWGALRR